MKDYQRKKYTERKKTLKSKKTIKGGKIQTIKGKYCSPKYTNSNTNSCYDIDSLTDIAKYFNRLNPNEPIDLKKCGKNFEKLWGEVDSKYKQKGCFSEECWSKNMKNIDYDQIDQEDQYELHVENELPTIHEKHFLPFSPRSWKYRPTEWLSNLDIRQVMAQYMHKHPDFSFIGPVPIDFSDTYDNDTCIVHQLCSFDIKPLLSDNIKKLGIIYNLDFHDGPGTHWVCSFSDLENGNTYYYDSYGYYPEKQIHDFLEKITSQLKCVNAKNCWKYNKRRHQFANSECGVYCLSFIISMLNGVPFENYTKRKLKDKQINQLRKQFWRIPK
jgi:hypothetical protein